MAVNRQPSTVNRRPLSTVRRNRVAVVGGGINGAGIAFELVRRDYDVVLFDKGACGAQTSSATTKLIHGGLRYLEHFKFGLVRESLRERGRLLRYLPDLVRPLPILLPIYDDSPRSRIVISAGLTLYDTFAGSDNIERHSVLRVSEIIQRVPLTSEGLLGGFLFWDAQVDDAALVRTVVASARREGAVVREFTPVTRIEQRGEGWAVHTESGEEEAFDLVVTAAGPWMNELLEKSGIRASYVLSLVRGSHLILRHRVAETGALLQSTSDRRIFFVLPWKETTLVGTTEVVQRGPLDDVHASQEEITYLIERYNRYFRTPISEADVESTFAGVRPLVGRASNPSAINRDYRVVRNGSIVHVFGGKMTTFMALARSVALRVDNYFGQTREAREPVFVRES